MGEHRIERGHRLLKDHTDLIAAKHAHEFLRGFGEVNRFALPRCESEPAAGDSPAAELDQAHEGERRDRFSRARLSHEADGLARINRERGAVHGDDGRAAALEFDPEILDLNQRPAGVVPR
jgi:hypothetical protein